MLERMISNKDHNYWSSGKEFFPVKNLYTAGVAGQYFLTQLKEKGRIMGTPCRECGVTYVPGRIYCEQCLSPLEDWVDMGLFGELFSYTKAYVDREEERREEPLLIGALKMGDGLLIHFLLDTKIEDLKVGQPFQVLLKPLEERVGSLRDILGFRPKP